jgi:hypothetical protein
MLGIEPLPTGHTQLSPLHIFVLIAAGFSLLFAQLPEEALIPEQWEIICMAQRVSFLLALGLLLCHVVVHFWEQYEKNLKAGIKGVEKSKLDLKGKTELKKDPDSLWVRRLLVVTGTGKMLLNGVVEAGHGRRQRSADAIRKKKALTRRHSSLPAMPDPESGRSHWARRMGQGKSYGGKRETRLTCMSQHLCILPFQEGISDVQEGHTVLMPPRRGNS